MELFTVLQFLGWLTVGLVMTIFVMTAGFDFGAGILLPFIGRNDAQRRVVINTVGPTWDGNQVWLITAGGALFAIWPRVYAASFSGFYFAFLLVLWSLFFRPVAFEYRSKIQSAKWRCFWDWALFAGSLLPPLIIGVGIGNLFLGLPFAIDPISLRFFYGHGFTDTSAFTALLGLLRPFALLTGIVSVLMMVMHGSAYLTMRTEGIVYERAKKAMAWASSLLVIAFALGGLWIAFGIKGYHWIAAANAYSHPLKNQVTTSVGGWLANYHRYPLLIIGPVLGFSGAVLANFWVQRDRPTAGFIASLTAILGILGTFGTSLFPFIMPSSEKPAESMLVWNATSSQLSLIGILVTAAIMLPIIFFYTAFVYRKMWGRGRRLSEQSIEAEKHVLY